MEIELDCDKIRQYFGDEIHSIVKSTLDDGIERGCYIKATEDKIILGQLQKGKETGLLLQRDSALELLVSGEEIIGTFHTHPDVEHDEVISFTDVKMLMDHSISIIMIGYEEEGSSWLSIFSDRVGNKTYSEYIDSIGGNHSISSLRRANRELKVCDMELWQLN